MRDRRGQSIVEAIVAITIVITAVMSALTLVQSSITASRIGGSQIVAANLAREGIEVVRSIRDSDWLQGNAFSVGLSNALYNTARPHFTPATGAWSLTFASMTLSSTSTQLFRTSQGAFVYAEEYDNSGVGTPYKRLLTINRICRNTASGVERIESTAGLACTGSETWVGLGVISQVQYALSGINNHIVTVEERLYDWR